MRVDRRYGDDRAERRDRGGLWAGALVGGAAGLSYGSAVAALPGVAVLALPVVVLTAVGALLGRWMASRISVEELDPSSEHRYVGARAPDDVNPGAGELTPRATL